MKLLLMGDAHFSNVRPENRTDKDYLDTLLGKFKQVEDIYYDRGCDMLLQPGDWFDRFARDSHEVVAAISSVLRESCMQIVCTFGQHDISGHSAKSLYRSPLRVLEASGYIKLLTSSKEKLNSWHASSCDDSGVSIYGAGFGQEVPTPHFLDNFNILLIHQMIGTDEIYPGQNIMHPNTFLKVHKKYDLVVAGDYHYRFVVKDGDRYCINPGALVRKTVGKRDLEHKPAVAYFNTETKTTEVIELKVKPVKDVFNLASPVKVAEPDRKALEELLDNLKKTEGSKISWQEILEKLLKENKASDKVRDVISDAIEEIRGLK